MDQLTAIASAIAALAGAVTAVVLLARAWKAGSAADLAHDGEARHHPGSQPQGLVSVLILQPAARCHRCGEGSKQRGEIGAPDAGVDAQPPHGSTIA